MPLGCWPSRPLTTRTGAGALRRCGAFVRLLSLRSRPLYVPGRFTYLVQAKKRKNMFGNLGRIFLFWKLGPFLLETWAGKIFLETRVGFFLETWVWVQGRPACTCLPLMSFSHVAGVTSSDLRHSRELRKHCQCLNTPHPPPLLTPAAPTYHYGSRTCPALQSGRGAVFWGRNP